MPNLTLPPGKTQFLDANGKPLAGGNAHHYIPSTSTPKDTWQDAAGTILNTNPVTLDSSGEAVILGAGQYRQVLTDRLGNQIWDQVVTVPDGAANLPLTGGILTGLLTTPSVNITGGQLITTAPYGDPVTTLTSLNVQGITNSTAAREYLVAFSLLSNKRNGAAGAVSPSAALYTGIQGQNGTDDIWSIRTTLTQDAASGTYDGIAHEITVVNNVANRGESLGAAGLVTPVTYGHAVDGTGAFRSTAAYAITGPGTAVFNRGLVVAGNAVAQAVIQDLGNSTLSYEIQGSHAYGIDAKAANFSGAFARLGNGQYIKARNIGDTLDYAIAVMSGTNLLIGDTASTGIVANHNIIPVTDNNYSIGSNGNRWAAIWAANGTIQTSDPSLKTDIEPLAALPDATILSLLRGIDPIAFRWVDGGGGEPGKRLHWGWDASQVKSAFDGIGRDFGGYVLEDGVQHMRPDQLVPVLWRAVQMLIDRVTALEGRTP